MCILYGGEPMKMSEMQHQNTLLHETESIIFVIENYLVSGVYMGVDKQKFLGRQCRVPLPRTATEN
jgi:hypothetical protein